jgi:hypothetical protein
MHAFVGGFGIVDSFAYSVTPSPVLASLLFLQSFSGETIFLFYLLIIMTIL